MLELGSLVRRDHDDLHYTLRVLGDPSSPATEVLEMRERVVALFPAHAEAETLALGAMLEHAQPPPSLYFLVSQVIASHLAQETALAQLLAQRVGTAAFRERVAYLRQLMVHHADHEAACVHPALPDHVPRDIYRTLAISYVIERDRMLEDHRKLSCGDAAIVRSA